MTSERPMASEHEAALMRKEAIDALATALADAWDVAEGFGGCNLPEMLSMALGMAAQILGFDYAKDEIDHGAIAAGEELCCHRPHSWEAAAVRVLVYPPGLL